MYMLSAIICLHGADFRLFKNLDVLLQAAIAQTDAGCAQSPVVMFRTWRLLSKRVDKSNQDRSHRVLYQILLLGCTRRAMVGVITMN